MKSLDLGCGSRKQAEMVGIDINPRSQADVIHDLNRFPYPFEDSTFDEIYADNSLEHLDDTVRVMEELHRICKPGSLIRIIVPYFRARWAFVDPTHRHFFTVDSFGYFDPSHPFNQRYGYSQATFTTEKIRFNEKITERGLVKPLRVLLKAFANRWPARYEAYLSHLFPLDELTFYLRTVK
jgi:predicted SAM-dependent methyltransferase